ncbi:hypothetical protein [Syntrophobacter fumaroxidans]|nr:hypothetical protein [Syntrophobacter fumaroxidans]
MEFFEGFSWAVPKGFSDPVAFCRFERGDTFYDTPKAYEVWSEALKHIKYSIRVQSPERAITQKRAQPPEGDITEDTEMDADSIDDDSSPEGADSRKAGTNADSLFSDNWTKEAVIVLTEYQSKDSRTITTTQGRVYTAVWKGDLSILEDDGPFPVPATPGTLIKKEKKKMLLENSQPFIEGLRADEKIADPTVFALPYDETLELYRNKFQRLRTTIPNAVILIKRPEEVDISHPNGFIPTMRIAFFIMESTGYHEAAELIKKALYKPANNRETETDRFKVSAHGFLFPDQSASTVVRETRKR